MLKIFRRVRQTFIEEGSLFKYLSYAVGEIILVVIGILIALQINQWNERRIERQKEKILLASLHQEFVDNREILDHESSRGEGFASALSQMLYLTGPKYDEIGEREFERIFYGAVSGSPHYDPKRNTFNEMISTGKLTIIRNEELRKLLTNWDNILIELKAQETLCNNYRENIKAIFIKNGSLVNELILNGQIDSLGLDVGNYQFDIDNRNLLTLPEFENNAMFRYLVLRNLVEYYEEIRNYINKIIQLTSFSE